MSRKTDDDISDEGSDLFRQMVGEVKPIEQNRVEEQPKKPKARPRQREADEREVVADLLSDHFDPELETGEEVHFLRPGLQKRVLRKLRRGQYAIEAELDLHGYRSEDARAIFSDFLGQCGASGQRCLRIIHGRAMHRSEGPVLRPLVHSWLRQRGDVLAFCTAPPHDGGNGAVYVLIKSRP